MLQTTAEANEELRRLRIARGLPGAYRVEDAAGNVVARYIVDHRGIAWAHVGATLSREAKATGRNPIPYVLERIADGELERVEVF